MQSIRKFNLTERLKQEWREDPVKVIVIGTAAAGAAAKLIDAMSAAQGRRAYAKMVNSSVERNRRN